MVAERASVAALGAIRTATRAAPDRLAPARPAPAWRLPPLVPPGPAPLRDGRGGRVRASWTGEANGATVAGCPGATTAAGTATALAAAAAGRSSRRCLPAADTGGRDAPPHMARKREPTSRAHPVQTGQRRRAKSRSRIVALPAISRTQAA